MLKDTIASAAVFVLGMAYWQLVSYIGGVAEPWDSSDYWILSYPLALLMAGAAGLLLKRHGWLAGALIVFAQLPVMWINAPGDQSIGMALVFLVGLAIPAAAVSFIASWVARHRSSDKAA